MASDSANKTEKPTPRRIEQAREQGQVAKSQDLNSALVLGGATLLMIFLGNFMFTQMYSNMFHTLSELNTFGKQEVTVVTVTETIRSIVMSLGWMLAPLFLGVSFIGILINLIQIKPMFSVKALQPKADKINPVSGFKRIFAMRGIVELAKALLKMALIGGIGTIIITSHLDKFMALMGTTVTIAWSEILETVALIALWSTGAFFVLGVADWRYQAYELEKQLKMTKQEIKDERKSQEGDPMIKSRVRQMGIQMSKNQQLASVPTADVVVTNPTHFSVAIKYDPDLAPAPMVVAKGVDHFAFKIRELAKESGVPCVENVPLARGLHKMVEVDMMIPPELFVTVAEVLALVYSKNKGRKLPKPSQT